MGDTLITVIAIIGGVVLMFTFPLMTMADRTDDMAQQALSTAITEFVDEVRTTGKLSLDDYSKFLERINSTGHTYDVDMKIGVLDENPGKKTTQAQNTKIGENVRYSKFTSQILDELDSKGSIALKEGDIFSVSAKNTDVSFGQQLNKFLFVVTDDDSYTLAGEDAGIVLVNGR